MAELEPQFLEGPPAQLSAQELRQAFLFGQGGVLGATDLKVTVGAGRSVDVAAGRCLIPGSSIVTVLPQGNYHAVNDAAKNSGAFELGGIPAQAANPRLDQIIARLYDQSHDGSGLRKWRFEVLTGVATAGATLDNRSGAATLPASSLRLADALCSSTGVVTVRDRRAWATGALLRSFFTGQKSTTSTTLVAIGAEFTKRIECSGRPLTVEFHGLTDRGLAGDFGVIDLFMDGARVMPTASDDYSDTGGTVRRADIVVPFVPTAGSHVFEWRWRTTNSGNFLRITDATMLVRELVGSSASND